VWEIKHSRARAFYEQFERREGDTEATHYCPGCGHGVLLKFLAEAIDDLQIQDRTILISPVGCSVFLYYYMDVGNIQAAHGRSPAVATGIKRVRPQSIVLCYQGDGDLAAIGGNEILQAANRGEDISVIFVNNAIYGMTGGQLAPTTLLGMKTTTSPYGRNNQMEGPPLRICELLASLDAPVYIERVALTDAKNHLRTRKAIRRAIQNQIEGKGFSFVEVLSPCPTNWRLTPADAVKFLEEKMIPAFPLGIFKEQAGSGTRTAAKAELTAVPKISAPSVLSQQQISPGLIARGEAPSVALKISGFGGQGILFMGIALAEAGMKEGLKVSWIPSYGVEMRGGTAHCHVRLSRESISSPLISRPFAVIAFNEPSVEKFALEIQPGGQLFVNSSMVKTVPERDDVEVVRIPALEAATELGNPKVANMIMLGAYLQKTGILNPESVLASLADHGSREELIRFNRRAMELGRNLAAGKK
jgi:2-oxoisovalerate ferredoxin oxidoreductase beta subunit